MFRFEVLILKVGEVIVMVACSLWRKRVCSIFLENFNAPIQIGLTMCFN